MSEREIVTIGTGGTISEVADARQGSGAGLDIADISAKAGDLDGIAVLRGIDALKVPGRAMRPADMLELAELVTAQAAAGCDGIVLTHGTDTMEETVYALAAMLDLPLPVLVTGSMRLPADAGHDGGANLRTAVIAAAEGTVRALGPMIAFQDELHLARWVTKSHTARVAAFSSPETGPAGQVIEDRVLLNQTRRPDDYLGTPQSLGETRVELIWVYAGLEARAVHALAEDADGLVVAGTGGGHTPPPVAEALEQIITSGIPIVIASRCPSGPMLVDTYDGAGSEGHLRSIGALSAGHLPALKTRLRLQVALALGLEPQKVFPA